MTLDEAIENLEQDVEINMYINDIAPQLAEWLKDYKRLKNIPEHNYYNLTCRRKCEKDGYNKAIDDFAEKLNAKCDGMIKDKWNSNVAPISWAEAYADFKDDIGEIAEQLKAGGENDRAGIFSTSKRL